jgi:transport and Golgi organization protein 2
MCTLTFFPTGQASCIITSNRDESLARKKASAPSWVKRNQTDLFMPVDGEAKGSWIAVSKKGRIAVLLNGAFEKHEHLPPYRLSRGIVLVQSFTFDDPTEFAIQYDFEGIEPFTMVIFETMPQLSINQIVWDGNQCSILRVDSAIPQIWSSTMLYPLEIRKGSLRLFHDFIEKNNPVNREKLLAFNRSELYSRKIKRNGDDQNLKLETLSISSITADPGQVGFYYYDLLHNKETTQQILLQP